MKNIFYVFLLTFLLGCTAEEQPTEESNLFPSEFELLYPENGSACLDGSIINDTQSKITFLWNSSTHAVKYTLNITNLRDNYSQKLESSERSLEVTLKHGDPYAWSVTALGSDNTATLTSEEWKFYLAGNGIVNYAPFPPELILPRPSALVTLNADNLLLLSWTCSDVEGDLKSYKVYLDQNDASTLIRTITASENTITIAVEAVADATYFWKVIAEDSEGNTASSGVYSFRTQ